MRQTFWGRRLHWLLVAGCVLLPGLASADEPHADAKHAAGVEKRTAIGKDEHHHPHKFDLSDPKQAADLMEKLRVGEIEEVEIEKATPNPLAFRADLGIWALVIFLAILIILQKYAWSPILEGLQKREETIKNSVEEAKKARADTERITGEFKVKMDQAYAEIPKIMEQARRDADAFKEEMRTQTAKEIQTERQRLRREIETARDQALQDLWHQAAQLATLISAKAIGRSLTEEDHRRLLNESITELEQTAKRG
jgi:F-type H+-transporting ATPase subunit b